MFINSQDKFYVGVAIYWTLNALSTGINRQIEVFSCRALFFPSSLFPSSFEMLHFACFSLLGIFKVLLAETFYKRGGCPGLLPGN